jgi:MFS superfamily sulfate permease-like transporter
VTKGGRSPISAVILAVALVSLVAVLSPAIRAKREEAFEEE